MTILDELLTSALDSEVINVCIGMHWTAVVVEGNNAVLSYLWSWGIPSFKVDVAAAKQLMADAGYAEGFEVTL